LNQINKKGEHMQRAMAVWFVAVGAVLWCGLSPLYAQEENKAASEDNKPKTERTEKPVHAYRIDFSIHELEDGKKINTRHYSMDLNSGPWSEIKIGTRVPVSPTQGSFQYIDLGTSIDCQVGEQGEDITLDIRSDFSNLSGPEEQHSAQPVIRQIKINGRTVTSPGRPAIIGAVDDPNSNRTFQLEAVATRLK
jgi:hypothetical protein